MVDTARMTVADVLQNAGYATAAIGKWHLGLGNADSLDYYGPPIVPGPLELGFDVFFGMSASLNMSPHCFIEGHHTVGIPDVPVPDHLFSNHGNGHMVAGWQHEEVGPTFTQKAVAFIDQHMATQAGQPFYLHLTPSAPHRPLYPPDFIRGRSQAGKRGDMVAEVDWTVSQVMACLQKHELEERTLVVLTSDNGAIDGNQSKSEDSLAVPLVYHHASNGPWRGSKTTIWEGGHRVPFLVHWPGKVPAGRVSREPICLTDWMATLAALTGQELPTNAGEDSFNLLPVLLGKPYASPVREALVTHSMWGKFAITQGKWKLILTQGSGGWGSQRRPDYPPGQLYDLSMDSLESNNLYDSHPEVVKNLEALLDHYRQSGRSR